MTFRLALGKVHEKNDGHDKLSKNKHRYAESHDRRLQNVSYPTETAPNLLPKAAAKYERTLQAVGCNRLSGSVWFDWLFSSSELITEIGDVPAPIGHWPLR